MKPQILIISAWGPYKDKVEIDFRKLGEQGLYLITGSTGAGKTTIFDAISFALFGDLSGMVREKDKVRSDFADIDTKTYVELVFTHRRVSYRISRNPRYLRPKKRGGGFTAQSENAELTLPDGKYLEGIASVNEKIEQLLGMNYAQFKQISMIAQGEFQKLLTASSKERTEIFRNIFHTKVYETIQQILTKQSKELRSSIMERKNKMEEAVHATKVDDESYQDMLSQENLPVDRIVEVLTKSIEEDQCQEVSLQEQLEILEKQAMELYESKIEAKQSAKKLEELQSVKEKHKVFQEEEKQIKDLEQKIQKAKRTRKVRPIQLAYSNIYQQYNEYKETYQALKEEEEKQEKLYQKWKKAYDSKDKLEALIDEKKETAQLYEQWMRSFQELGQLQKSLFGRQQQMEQGKEQLEDRKKIISLKEDTIKEAKERFTKLHSLEAEQESLENQIKSRFDRQKRYRVLLQLANDLKKMEEELVGLQASYRQLDEEAKKKKQKFEYYDDCYKKAAAGLLAANLSEGAPCPVCGAVHHPNKAVITNSVLKEEELQKLKREYDKALKKVETSQQKAAQCHGNVIARQEQVKEELTLIQKESISEVKQAEKNLQDELKAMETNLRKRQEQLIQREKLAAEMTELENDLQKKKEEIEKLEESMELCRKEYMITEAGIESVRKNIPNHITSKEKLTLLQKENEVTLKQYQKNYNEILAEYQKAGANRERILGLRKQKEEDCKKAKSLFDDKRQEYKEALQENGFDTVESYSESILEDNDISKLETNIQVYYREKKSNEDYLLRLTKECEQQKPVDLEKLNEQEQVLTEKKKSLEQRKKECYARSMANERSLVSIQKNKEEMLKLEEIYGKMSDLERVSRGENAYRLIFEQYVLANYFDEILQAANVRLNKMSFGRYSLFRVQQVNDARTKSSLDIEVLDQYTGKLRHINTLSGGESFKAALSLALGMSDVIQQHAGGVKVEALFIDEGFGALDSESLDQALNTLTGLVSEHCMIGIISHVAELKERIEKKILIEKSNMGSTAVQ